MKKFYIASQLVLVLAIPASCLMAITLAVTASPPVASQPHRQPSTIVPGPVKRKPYAPPPPMTGLGPKRLHSYEPLHVTAQKATKTWNRTAWVATGGIERRHFWLSRPIDTNWHRRLFYLHRQRLFWWHHRHLYYLLWLGQGWEYLDGTRPTTQPAISVADTTGGGDVVPLSHTRPVDVALRVQALSVLNGLQLTTDQFGLLQDSLGQLSDAGDVVDADVIDHILATNPICLDVLNQLYKDFVLTDDDQILDDQDRLIHLQDKNQVCVDPTVIVSSEARAQATQVFGLLSASQIASYLAARGQVIPDPTEMLLTALNQSRQLSAVDFVDYSNCVADRFAILTAGLDATAEQPIIRQVKDMFEQARGLSDADFAARRPDFEHQARDIEKSCDPIDLVHHGIEWDLANFMANPQAKAMVAIRARQLHESS